jgi:hypothetical protein
LVVGRAGFVGLIVVVSHGVDRLRFAAAAIPDRFGRWRFTRVGFVGGSTGLISVIVLHGVERFRFAAAAIPDRFGRWGFTCVVVGLGVVGGFGFVFGFVVGWV